jgi:hypothetical protein
MACYLGLSCADSRVGGERLEPIAWRQRLPDFVTSLRQFGDARKRPARGHPLCPARGSAAAKEFLHG